MKLKSLDKTANTAWSPGGHGTLLALGTSAGAIDPSFSATTELEIYNLNLNSKGLKMTRMAGIPLSAR